MTYDSKDPWFYNRCYLEALGSWPGRTPEEIQEKLAVYVLMLATLQGDLFQIERILVSHSAQIDDRIPEYAGTALWYAAHKNYPDLVDYLLDFRPNLTIVNEETGTNPYQEAVLNGHTKIAEMIATYKNKK